MTSTTPDELLRPRQTSKRNTYGRKHEKAVQLRTETGAILKASKGIHSCTEVISRMEHNHKLQLFSRYLLNQIRPYLPVSFTQKKNWNQILEVQRASTRISKRLYQL